MHEKQHECLSVSLVYATMRDLAKKKRLMDCVKDSHKDTMDVLQMDITHQQSILDVRDSIKEKRIDILGKGSPILRRYCSYC